MTLSSSKPTRIISVSRRDSPSRLAIAAHCSSVRTSRGSILGRARARDGIVMLAANNAATGTTDQERAPPTRVGANDRQRPSQHRRQGRRHQHVKQINSEALLPTSSCRKGLSTQMQPPLPLRCVARPLPNALGACFVAREWPSRSVEHERGGVDRRSPWKLRAEELNEESLALSESSGGLR